MAKRESKFKAQLLELLGAAQVLYIESDFKPCGSLESWTHLQKARSLLEVQLRKSRELLESK
jgi:hypothetical protein